MRKARETSLLSKWARGGRLTADERGEIEHLLPAGEHGPEATAALPPPVSARSQYRKLLRDYVTIFDTKVRQIKRWVAAGKAAVDEKGNPRPDLPPLDDPPKMAAWWEKNMTQRVPAKLLALAVEARINPESEKTDAVDVDNINVDSLDSLRQARRYLAAIDRKLSAAYAVGAEAAIRRWQKPFNDALESVRKAEAGEREAAKVAGDLIPKAELFSELSQALETQRQMRSTMSRRVCRRLPDLSSELLARIGAAIDAEREGEDAALRNLKQFRTMEEVHLQLEALPA